MSVTCLGEEAFSIGELVHTSEIGTLMLLGRDLSAMRARWWRNHVKETNAQVPVEHVSTSTSAVQLGQGALILGTQGVVGLAEVSGAAAVSHRDRFDCE